MRKIIYAFFTLILFLSELSSQIVPEWATNYASNYPIDIGENDMTADKNGNVYIIGYTRDTSYNVKGVTLKYNTYGQFQWIQYYDSISYYSKIAIDDSGNVYVAAHTINGLRTIKYNTQGILKWARSFPTSGPGVWAYDIITDNSYNVYVTGLCSNRFTTIKYNSSGSLMWSALDATAMGIGFSYITLDNSQNVYVAIRGLDTINSSYTCNTIKYNSSGIKKWEQIHKGNFNPTSAAPVDIKFDPSGFIYVLSMATNNNDGEGDYNVVKYDTLGNQLWTFSYSFTTYYDVPRSLAIDKTGNVYVTGNIYPTGGTIDSIATIKINNAGSFKWKKTYSYGYANNDEASGIAIDSSGYIFVVGKSSGSSNRENFVTIKYDSLGNEIWVGRYCNTNFSSDEGNSISLDKFGNVYVCGTTSELNSSGILTLKYAHAVGIQDLLNNSNAIVSIYPNPVSNTLHIESEQYFDAGSVIEITNCLGQIVSKQPYKNEIDVSRISDGCYFLKITTNNNQSFHSKFIKQ